MRRLVAALGIGRKGETTVVEEEAEEVGQFSDYHISPGGVSRMVLQSVRAWRSQGKLATAHWFSLQPNGPPRLLLEDAGIHLHHLRLPPQELAAYARMKERLWSDIHGLQGPPGRVDGRDGKAGAANGSSGPRLPGTPPTSRFGMEDFRYYARYNSLVSDAYLGQVSDLDVAYVHDFQLLQVGAIVGLAAPCVLRWHVPFDPKRTPVYTRQFLVKMMQAYDGVIVSTRRELEGLSNGGYRGKVRQLYPHSDVADWASPPPSASQELEERLNLPADAKVILLVARMDPMKRQDLAIEATARIRRKHPEAHLVLVGNGSFSGSKGSGLGLSKSAEWRRHLETLVQDLNVSDRVRFTGWMPDRLVAAAYARADMLVLPSDIEGFGLTPFEAWGHGKPCVVSDGCGCAEIVQDGVNGCVFPAGDGAALAAAFERILEDSEAAIRMGEAGRITLESHQPDQAAKAEVEFLEDALQRYRRRQ